MNIVQTVNSELIWETFFFTATVCVNRAYREWVWLTGNGCGFLEWVWLKRTGCGFMEVGVAWQRVNYNNNLLLIMG